MKYFIRRNNTMKCFYHNDPDGWCSAYWVRKYCERENIPFTREDFIEVNYDSPRLIEKVEQNEKVFMVDFSVDPEQMILFATNTDFVWIDHHISSIEKMQPYMNAYDFKGIRNIEVAACALTWVFFNWDLQYSWDISDLPEFTKLIHLWDTWQWKNLNKFEQVKVEAFIISLIGDPVSNNPLSTLWDCFVDNATMVYKDFIDAGNIMLNFRDELAKSLCSSIGHVVNFGGYKCFACNIPKPNSEWFKSVDTSTYDIMMPFYYNLNTGLYILSLYTTNPDIDVSKIAEKYGGGGHKAAAGFQLKELPF